MIRVVVYLSGKAECQLLETQLRQLLSRRSNEELDCRFYADPAAARAGLLAERADAICWDVTDLQGWLTWPLCAQPGARRFCSSWRRPRPRRSST